MKTLLSIALVAFATMAVSTSVAQADSTTGTCNSTVATAMRAAQVCDNFGCFPDDLVCAEVGAAFLGFLGDPVCLGGFLNGDLHGVTTDAADGKHVGGVICSALAQCDFCDAALAIGTCLDDCL